MRVDPVKKKFSVESKLVKIHWNRFDNSGFNSSDKIVFNRLDKTALRQQKKRERERNQIEFDSNGAFAVQVEAWRSRDKAQAQVQKWVERGYENAYVVKMGNEETGDIWFRVRLGRVASKAMAKKLEAKVMNNHNEEAWTSMAKEEQDTTETTPKTEE